MTDLAPIALFVYKRPRHTQQTLESLAANEGASESELFIFCDGPKRPEDAKAVEEVRRLVKSRQWCGKINIIERDKNLGLANSIISGVTQVVTAYGKIIVLEDDMVSSPYFLKFMNDALEFYETEERVISIHGYVYPIKTQLPETFFIKDTGCWGWATWKRGWDLFEADGQKLLKELEERRLTKKFDMNGSYNFTKMLRDQTQGKNDSWAIRWQASAFLKDKLTLFPGKSLIKNIGFDSTGTHCNVTNSFDVEVTMKPIKIEKISIQENPDGLKEFERYFKSIKQNKFKQTIDMTRRLFKSFKITT